MLHYLPSFWYWYQAQIFEKNHFPPSLSREPSEVGSAYLPTYQKFISYADSAT